MDHYSFYDSARELGRVDRLVNTPGLGGTRVAARRLRSYLQSLHHVLVGQKGGESIDPRRVGQPLPLRVPDPSRAKGRIPLPFILLNFRAI